LEGIEHRAGSQVIKSLVPLAEMLATPPNMRSNTQGRATFSMHFAHYDEAPRAVTEEMSPRYRASRRQGNGRGRRVRNRLGVSGKVRQGTKSLFRSTGLRSMGAFSSVVPQATFERSW